MTLTIGHSDAPKRSGCGLGSVTRSLLLEHRPTAPL